MVEEAARKPLFSEGTFLQFREDITLGVIGPDGKLNKRGKEHLRSLQPMEIISIAEWNPERECYRLWVKHGRVASFSIYEDQVCQVEEIY